MLSSPSFTGPTWLLSKRPSASFTRYVRATEAVLATTRGAATESRTDEGPRIDAFGSNSKSTDVISEYASDPDLDDVLRLHYDENGAEVPREPPPAECPQATPTDFDVRGCPSDFCCVADVVRLPLPSAEATPISTGALSSRASGDALKRPKP